MDYTRLCYVPAAGGLSSEMTIHWPVSGRGQWSGHARRTTDN